MKIDRSLQYLKSLEILASDSSELIVLLTATLQLLAFGIHTVV